MTLTNLLTGIKQVNSSILALETWLMILQIIQLVNYLLKKSLNTLNKIKDAEIIKHKKHTPKHKELLNLFNDLLDTILTDKILESKSQEDKNENENENKDENDKALMSSKDDIENENENDKTLMSSNEDDEDDDDDETIDQTNK